MCDDDGCTPAGVLDFSGSWVGSGDIEAFRSHSQFKTDARGNMVSHGRLRAATASATVDGRSFVSPADSPAALRTVTTKSNTG